MKKEQLRTLTLQAMAKIQKIDPNKELAVLNRLVMSDTWQKANCIGLTVSKFPEISTDKLIEYAWKENKTVCVPVANHVTRSLTFYKITSNTEFLKNRFGILEPVSGADPVLLEEIELLLVPGIVFNMRGHRIGYGGGYYDRLLEKFSGKTISIAFYDQIANNFKVEKHDQPIDRLVTEYGEVDFTRLKNRNTQKKLFPTTASLISVNIFIFLLTLLASKSFTPSVEVLISFGGNYRLAVSSGEVWRLCTSIFLHGSFAHLGLNMLSLYMLGNAVEDILGHFRFLALYFGAGIIASLTSFAFLNDFAVSVGASGAIFGLLGSFFYYGFFCKNNKYYFNMTNLIIILVLNLGIGFSSRGIDNAAHIGGLIGGFFITMIIIKIFSKPV